MQPKEFIHKLDEEKVVAAIAAAEKKTSGEIRVYVSSKKREDAFDAGKNRFEKLGMTKTRDRNAVLIYFAPVTRKFAILGDTGIHAKCGDNFWQSITAEMSNMLKSDDFTGAVVHAVKRVGEALAEHFPPKPDDTNELPNSIIRD